MAYRTTVPSNGDKVSWIKETWDNRSILRRQVRRVNRWVTPSKKQKCSSTQQVQSSRKALYSGNLCTKANYRKMFFFKFTVTMVLSFDLVTLKAIWPIIVWRLKSKRELKLLNENKAWQWTWTDDRRNRAKTTCFRGRGIIILQRDG